MPKLHRYQILYKDLFYDNPPKNQRFALTNVSWLRDTGKDNMKKQTLHIFSCLGKGLSNDNVRGAKGTAFEEIQPGAGRNR